MSANTCRYRPGLRHWHPLLASRALGRKPLVRTLAGERLVLFRTASGRAAALAAGDHNGSTLEQHRRFRAAALGAGPVEVTLDDGLAAVVMGLAAQESIRTGQAMDLRTGPYALA